MNCLDQQRFVNSGVQVRVLLQVVTPSLLDEDTLARHPPGPPDVVYICGQVADRYDLASGRLSQQRKTRGNPLALVRHLFHLH